ncbi:hypothetical protein GGX14DRAFT_565551 [Mycena pura]|uniref:SAM domain-containing protein n=1 Tax=Mycena pura TaxID=153505 RepID=A0AAD6VHT4_9AGAR|nr:hypothetical protein GGX14DRAFT_565551 [Mycena pura]
MTDQRDGGPPPFPPYAYYYPYGPLPPSQPQVQPHMHTSQYLMGMTPHPPPPSRHDIAVAGLRRELDGGSFDHAQNSTQRTQIRPQAAARSITAFQVLIPTPTPNGTAPTDVTLTINRNLDAGDFLARVRANMEVPDNVPVGWRLSNEAKKDVRRLATIEDATMAMQTILGKLDNPQRRNEVFLKIVDTREKQKPAKEVKEVKATETAYREELAIVKEKLRCEAHGQCYIRKSGPLVGQHVTLDFEAMTLWARAMPDEVPRDCSAPPNCLDLDKYLQKKERRQRTSRGLGAETHVDVNPNIHIHLADTPLGPAFTNHLKPDDGGGAVLGKRAREAVPDDEDPPIVPIEDLLAELHAKMPAAGFAEYKDALNKEQVQYCHQVLDLTEPELMNIGIGRGGVKDLVRGAKRMLRAKKVIRVDDGEKENVPVTV